MIPIRYLVGLDLGQAHDFTAVVVVRQLEEAVWTTPTGERLGPAEAEARCARARLLGKAPPVARAVNHYELAHLERLPLDTSYPAVVRFAQQLLRRRELRLGPGATLLEPPTLVVDATGCGRPVVDLLRAAGLQPVAISITGGDAVSFGTGSWKVPKRDLVASLQVLLQSGRLRLPERHALVPQLVAELQAFRVKIDPVTTHDSYGAWREGEHDDLVLATAVAAWWGERHPRASGEYAIMGPGVGF